MLEGVRGADPWYVEALGHRFSFGVHVHALLCPKACISKVTNPLSHLLALGFSGAVFKKFDTHDDAKHFVCGAADPGPVVRPDVVVRFDGGARGNPGEAGAGAVVYRGGSLVFEGYKYFPHASNNGEPVRPVRVKGSLTTLYSAPALVHLVAPCDIALGSRLLMQLLSPPPAPPSETVAEYEGLVLGLVAARRVCREGDAVLVCGDSSLVVNQARHGYRTYFLLDHPSARFKVSYIK